MRVLQVSAELFPLLKTGGLADIAGALPLALIAAGQDVRVLLPGFPALLAGVADAVTGTRFAAPLGERGDFPFRRIPIQGTPGIHAYSADAPVPY